MLRCIYRIPWETPNEELYAQTNEKSLKDRRDVLTLIMTHNCINDSAPHEISQMISLSDSTARAIEQKRAVIPRVIRTNLFKNSFPYRGASLWNLLTPLTRTNYELGSFRRHLFSNN